MIICTKITRQDPCHNWRQKVVWAALCALFSYLKANTQNTVLFKLKYSLFPIDDGIGVM
jgi:hypothetical protein